MSCSFSVFLSDALLLLRKLGHIDGISYKGQERISAQSEMSVPYNSVRPQLSTRQFQSSRWYNMLNVLDVLCEE